MSSSQNKRAFSPAVSEAGTSKRLRSSPANMDGSVHDYSQGHTYIITGNQNSFVHGPSLPGPRSETVRTTHLHRLVRSHNAEYDMALNATRGPCTAGTRIYALKKLMDWSTSGTQSLYWLNGMAGTGKTTITFSLCQKLEDAELLGASFFCSRSLPDCRDINLILPTIAFQLARRYPVLKGEIDAVLQDDEDILRRSLAVQLRKLIIQPCKAMRACLPQIVVIVLDALDECERGHADFLRVLFDNANQLPLNLKFLISSRPESPIRNTIMSESPQIRSMFVLHEVEEDLVNADIVKYLQSKLSHYTTPSIIDSIAELSGSLFIYAATLARLFATGRVNIPKCIQDLLSSASTRNKSQMMATLDELYREVLLRVLSGDLLEDSSEEIKDVLYTIVCAREPLTRRGLAELWDVAEEEINRRLDLLRSVLFISDDYNFPITAFHASFSDFILDPTRSEEFCCQPQSFNLKMTKRCLATMNEELHQNICRLHGRPANRLIHPEIIDLHIRPGLRYAITHYAVHWAQSGVPERQAISSSIRDFVMTHVLHWVECLSLLGRLPVCVQSLEYLLNGIDEDSDAVSFVHDSLRLIQRVYELIEYSAIEIYSSALVWTPLHSPLRTQYASLCNKLPRILSGLPSSWIGPERVIDIYSGGVISAVITQDGKRIVSGSRNVVRIWNHHDQIEECILPAHTTYVNSVAISTDGSLVISGSDDRTIRVWDRVKHQASFTAKAFGRVLAVAISPNGSWIASGQDFDWNGVCIWDAKTGRLIHSGNGHKECVRSVSFSANSTSLVSASDDCTARIWNVLSGETEVILHGHSGGLFCVACSSVGKTILTGSGDKTARLWNFSGEKLQIFRGHSDCVHAVAFVPSGPQIITGSADGTLRLWNPTNGDTLNVFTGAGQVRAIAVFPDGEKVASGSDRGVAIWRLKAIASNDSIAAEIIEELSLTLEATGMAFSSDGKSVLLLPSLRLLAIPTLEEKVTLTPQDVGYEYGVLSASGCRAAATVKYPHVIFLWKLTGNVVVGRRRTLTGHIMQINAISFSSTEQQLVTASSDRTAQVWDVITGQKISVFSHFSEVYDATFTHDETRIASMTKNIAYIWEAQSGECLYSFPTTASSIMFTPDDRYIITSDGGTVSIWNTQTSDHGFMHIHNWPGHDYWQTFDDGSSYAISNDGWVYYFPHFDGQPHKLIRIPFQYRPTLSYDNLGLSGPVFTSSSQGVQLCLPREDGLITLIIPLNDHYSP